MKIPKALTKNNSTDQHNNGKLDSDIFHDVIHGLSAKQKFLPCKYLYDETGSQLFDKICNLPEYYPTRTEVSILKKNVQTMGNLFKTDVRLVEFGSGSSQKVRILLDAINLISTYIPIDISEEYLVNSTNKISLLYPNLNVTHITADYMQDFSLPMPLNSQETVGFFPGSTIGNFTPDKAKKFLIHIGKILGSNSKLIIGVDLKKPLEILEPAYNDASGVTAKFNLNILRRINKEINVEFKLENFFHQSFWNPLKGCMEMHLVSKVNQSVLIHGKKIIFNEGESIHTESSYKYEITQFIKVSKDAGWTHQETWTDDNDWFSVHYLEKTNNNI